MRFQWALVVLVVLAVLASWLEAQDSDPYDQSKVVLEKDVVNDPKAPKIVLIAGRISHGPGDHEFFAGTAILQKMLIQNGVNAVMARDGWPKDEKIFDGAASIMMYMDGGGGHPLLKKENGQSRRLELMQELLKNGAGFACLHYAVEYPKDYGPQVLPMLGGYFEPYWSVNPHWIGHFLEMPKHPVTRGVQPFKIHDEWYYHMRFVPEMKGVTPILTAVPPDKTRGPQGANEPHGGNPHVYKRKGMPEHVAWVYERGDGGRSFGFTGGHRHSNWSDENFRRLVVNALLWTAKVEIPEGGAKVEMDPEEIKRNLDDKRKK